MATRRPKKRGKARRAAADPAASELLTLIEAVTKAKERGDRPGREAAINALTDFRTRPVSPELRERAAEARDAAANEDIAEALSRLKAIAARMSTAGPALDEAAAIAAQGQKKLLFPRLAQSAQAMLATVSDLKQAAVELKAQLEDARELGDLPKILDGLRAQLEKLEARAKSLQE
jgi:hypothetical protein